MDVRQMRYVLAVAEHGNVRRAATSLHLAQQSLSEQLAAVEREIGAPLFARHRTGMTLTPVGEVFIAHAAVAVDASDRVLTATRLAARSVPDEPVRIAVATGLSVLSSQLLRRYLMLHPGVEVQLTNATSADQVIALGKSEITAGLAYAPLLAGSTRTLTQTKVLSMPVCALLRADDPLAAGASVSLTELVARPLLLPTQHNAAGLRAHLLGVFTARGLRPRLGPVIFGHEFAAALVASGRGYTLCVPSLVKVADDLVFRPLAETVVPIGMVLLTARADRSAATQDLVRVAQTIARTKMPQTEVLSKG